MKQKSLIISIILCVVGLFYTSTASAQNRGELLIGPRMSMYTNWKGALALGAFGRIGVSDALRIEPSVMFFCNTGSSVDISCNVHYALEIEQDLEIYPLVGLATTDYTKVSLGVNYGGGLNYQYNQSWVFNFELRAIESFGEIKNPLAVSFGGAYLF